MLRCSSRSFRQGFAQPNPNPMFPNPPGLLRLEPHSPGLRDRIWWARPGNATADTVAHGHDLQSLDPGNRRKRQALHVQQAEQIRLLGPAWAESASCTPRVSGQPLDLCADERHPPALFRRAAKRRIRSASSKAPRRIWAAMVAEPDQLIRELAEDEGIAEADTPLLTVPNMLGAPEDARRGSNRS